MLIIDKNQSILLDLLTDPLSKWLRLKFYLKDFHQSVSEKVFQLDWSDWEMELIFTVIS